MSREIEWPKGSGRVAMYSSEELEFMRALTLSRENGEITDREFRAQIDFIHDAKVLFDARLLSREQEIERGYRTAVEGHGAFHIPEVAQLGLGDVPADMGPASDSTGTQEKVAATDDPAANTVGKWRRDDPETARKAAIFNYPRSGSQRWRILQAAYAAGERGVITGEMEGLGIVTHSASTRISELVQGGWLLDTGRERESRFGAAQKVCVISEKGRTEIEERERVEAQSATA